MQYKYFEREIEWIEGEAYTKVLSENGILTRRRKELGMTQEEVAEQVGIQLCQYQRFESGERTLSGSSGRILLSVSKVLQLDPFIFIGSGNESTERHVVIPQNFANAVKAQAAINHCTEADIICDALDSYLFGKNEDDLIWYHILYDDASLAVLYILTMVFMAAGMRRAKHPNGEPLVALFAQEVAKCTYRFDADDDKEYLITALHAIAKLLATNSKCEAQQLLLNYIDRLQHSPEDVMASDIVELIMRNFDVLGGSAWTYRALGDIAVRVAGELPDNAEARTAFSAVLHRLCASWPR